MLSIDISNLSDDEVAKRVAEKCAPFGTVKGIRIFRTAEFGGNQFALAEMSSPEETDKVVRGVGDAKLGDAAVIRFTPFGPPGETRPGTGMPQVDFGKSFEKQLFRPDEPLIEEFVARFPEDVREFHAKITRAAEVCLGFHRSKGDRRDLDAASLFLFNGINCLAMSMRLLLSGYLVPSGNLCRNVLESVAIASLISEPKTKCFERLENEEEFASQAVYWMKKNANTLGYNGEGVQELIDLYKFFHHFSHPSIVSLGSVVTGGEGPLVLGGIFAANRHDDYKTEIQIRIRLANLLTDTAGVIHVLQCAEQPERPPSFIDE
jgi:hypothetical protein